MSAACGNQKEDKLSKWWRGRHSWYSTLRFFKWRSLSQPSSDDAVATGIGANLHLNWRGPGNAVPEIPEIPELWQTVIDHLNLTRRVSSLLLLSSRSTSLSTSFFPILLSFVLLCWFYLRVFTNMSVTVDSVVWLSFAFGLQIEPMLQKESHPFSALHPPPPMHTPSSS